ncbi:hypothetical protein GGF37_003078 [Kickxella alabastrina]|nr:hypothetical protein GGF37_003078 [Kickxella alabastrina]
MFKATMATDPMDMETEDKKNLAKDAAEAEAEAAEQSWFDNCIDTMITEEEDEDEEDMDMDLDEDEDLNMEGDSRCAVFDPRNGPSPIDTKISSNGNASDDSGSSDNSHAGPLLKRSCSANSIHNFHLPGHLSLVSQT